MLVALAAVATPLLAAGPAVYFANLADFDVSLRVMLPGLLAFAAFLWALLTAGLQLLSPPHRERAIALVLGAAVLCWVQANLLAWDYGVFDGRQIDWGGRWWQGAVDGGVWLGGLALCWRFAAKVRAHAGTVVGALLLVQFVPLAAAGLAAPQSPNHHIYTVEYEHKYDFSRERNVVILVLDAFQADVMQEILEERPEYFEVFDGFAYYRNAAAGYAKTYPTFSLMLTGEWYENDVPIQDFLHRSFEHRSITSKLLEKGWRVDLFPRISRVVHHSKNVASNMVRGTDPIDAAAGLGKLVDVALFRSVPHFVKPLVVNGHRWHFRRALPWLIGGRADRVAGRIVHPHHAVRFLDSAEVYSTAQAPAPAFKLYHLMMPHKPFDLNERLEVADLPSGRRGFVRHSTAALEVAGQLIERLRELDVYDETMIFIVSDHGGGEYDVGIRDELLPEALGRSEPGRIRRGHHQGALPLVMVKPFGGQGRLAISDRPVSLADIARTTAAALDLRHAYGGENILELDDEAERRRRYLFYTFDGWARDYLPPMTEYELQGHSWLAQNWRATGRVLEPAGETDAK